MGLRLFSEFKSSNGKQYKIEIHQTGFVGTTTSFNVAEDGFQLEYNGETDDIVSPIIGSKCVVSAYNNVGTFDTFMNKVLVRQDDEFFMKILLHDGVGYNDTFWSGLIMQDLMTDNDVSKPRIVQITATDGIGFLANEEYTGDGDTTIENFIKEAVQSIGLSEVYLATEHFYATIVNVWDTNMTFAKTTTDVSTLIRFDSLVYQDKEEDGTIIFPKYLDILQELCVAFGARFYQRDGIFYFEQYLEREASSRYVTTYQYDGTKVSTASVSDDITLNQTTSGGARKGGNTFTYLPALQKVIVSFNQERASNLLGNNVVFTPSTGFQNLGFVPNTNNDRLQIETRLEYQLTLNTTPPSVSFDFYRPVWKVQIRIEDIQNPGTYYYLKRDWSPGSAGAQIYGATTWTTTASYYYIDAGIAINEATGLFISGSGNIVTPPFPVAGNAEIDIDFHDVFDNTNNSQSVPSYFDETRISIAERIVLLNDTGALSEVEVFSATNTDSRIKSNLTLDLGQLRISDAAGMQGSFYVYNGTGWVRSTLWRRDDTGTFINLYKLLTSEILSLHRSPVERYDGTIISDSSFGRKFVFDSSDWLMMRGTYNANIDEWNGEWFKFNKQTTNITIDTPVGSGGGGTATERISAQQGTDEIITAVKVNTTDADVTNNATIGGTLGVTGASTLNETSVGNFTTTGSVSVTINDVDASAGGSENLSLARHTNFINYSGEENGTYTINLPSAVDGALLRFKTDSSISATKKVHLSPQTGETIDGNTEPYQMDRSFDGLTLMGHTFGGSTNWFVIQKKEK